MARSQRLPSMARFFRLLRSALLCGLAWLGVGAAAAAPVEVAFNSLDGTLIKGWLFLPDDATPSAGSTQPTRPRSVVLALHGCGGLYPGGAVTGPRLSARHQAMADLLLKEGYAVLFPDSFGPRGVREICTQRISSRGISQTERRRDTLGALAWAGRQAWAQPDKVAVLGWSHGGSAVLAATDAGQAEVAAQGARFARAIAFYPGLRRCAESQLPSEYAIDHAACRKRRLDASSPLRRTWQPRCGRSACLSGQLPRIRWSIRQGRAQGRCAERRSSGSGRSRRTEPDRPRASAGAGAQDSVRGASIASGRSSPGEHQVPDTVAKAQAAVLELGERAVIRPWRIAFYRVAQERFSAKDDQHLFGVGLPVGRAVQVAARLQPLCQRAH